jgi:hypothetical protein
VYTITFHLLETITSLPILVGVSKPKKAKGSATKPSTAPSTKPSTRASTKPLTRASTKPSTKPSGSVAVPEEVSPAAVTGSPRKKGTLKVVEELSTTGQPVIAKEQSLGVLFYRNVSPCHFFLSITFKIYICEV